MKAVIAIVLVMGAMGAGPAPEPWIGVVAKDRVSKESPKTGAIVVSIDPDSPAEKLGISEGDIITIWDGKKISSKNDLDVAIRACDPGKQYVVGVIRKVDGANKLAERPIVMGARAPETPEQAEARQFKTSVRAAIKDRKVIKGMTIAEARQALKAPNTFNRTEEAATKFDNGSQEITWDTYIGGVGVAPIHHRSIIAKVGVDGVIFEVTETKFKLPGE